MRTQYLLILILACGCLAAAEHTPPKPEQPGQKAQRTETKRFAFPHGGLLRLKHSIGDLTIEAWDNPDLEITVVKSSKTELTPPERERAEALLDQVTVSNNVSGDQITINTSYRRYRRFPPPLPWQNAADFDLEYHISVPRDARLAIDHDVGSVNVDGVTGDIEANVLQGEIMLHLPEDAQYRIRAKSEFGNVNSDFPGQIKRKWLQQSAFHDAEGTPHTLNLKIGYGDIVILKIRVPKRPEPLARAPKGNGL